MPDLRRQEKSINVNRLFRATSSIVGNLSFGYLRPYSNCQLKKKKRKGKKIKLQTGMINCANVHLTLSFHQKEYVSNITLLTYIR